MMSSRINALGILFSLGLAGSGLVIHLAYAAAQHAVSPPPPPELPAAAVKPSGDNLQAARQELGAAWDAGTAAEQRKTNAVVGVINATNASLTTLQKQASDLAAEHLKDLDAVKAAQLAATAAQGQLEARTKALSAAQAEVDRLTNALAAEKRAEAIKPNPALKKQPGKVVGDHGQPLILTTPGMPGIGHLNPSGATKP